MLTDDGVEMAVGPGRAIACEFLLTAFVIVAVLLTTLEEKTKSHAAPTAVGFAYVVGILSGCVGRRKTHGIYFYVICLTPHSAKLNDDGW